jgi:hypothetical protein
MAVGPDGNLWFAGSNFGSSDSMIGRITTAGALTEFPLRPGHQPASIAPGPDGNLWFTEKDGNRIGRITPSGAITEFPLSGPNGRPDQIVLGPDGNLWFTFEAANKVGRISPLGEVDQFPVPTSTGTEAIVAGPDGNIWFTSRDRLGSISPRGRPARLSCPNRECHRRREQAHLPSPHARGGTTARRSGLAASAGDLGHSPRCGSNSVDRSPVTSPALIFALSLVSKSPVRPADNVTSQLLPADRSKTDSESQDQSKSFIHNPQLSGIKAAGGVTEALRVDHSGLLDQNSGFDPAERDRWPEGRRARAGGGRRN